MEKREHRVDGFRFLPPGLAAWLRTYIPKEDFSGTIPWTPMAKPLKEASICLVTSAGISLKSDPPFDMERERQEPTWGDPTYRSLPKGTTEKDIQVHHLHINPNPILQDMNVVLPMTRMEELEQEGVIGRMAPTSYSFYGFQWESEAFLDLAIMPMAKTMKEEGVDAVFLTPA